MERSPSFYRTTKRLTSTNRTQLDTLYESIQENNKQILGLEKDLVDIQKTINEIKRQKIKFQKEIHSIQRQSGREIFDVVKLALSKKDSPRESEVSENH